LGAKLDKESGGCEVISSLGFNNLALTNESLLWIGAGRVEGIHTENLVAEILLRRSKLS
jgi:hypothetical protein